MKAMKQENVHLDYILSGKGDTTLLFVHGAFIDKDYWQDQVGFFSSNYKVVTLDLAGHGKSGSNRSDWSIQALGEDIVTVIKELSLSNIILIGHSLGGDVILEAADRVPELIAGFIGIDNFKNAGTAMPAEMQKKINEAFVLMKTNFADVSEGFARQALLTQFTDSQISYRILKDYRDFNPVIGIPLLRSSFTYHNRERELLERLKFKLHLINVDYIPTNEKLLKLYAKTGYDIARIKGTCHYPMIEEPEEFNQILQNTIVKILANK
jgi:sigma-B regulation protein RsbQ